MRTALLTLLSTLSFQFYSFAQQKIVALPNQNWFLAPVVNNVGTLMSDNRETIAKGILTVSASEKIFPAYLMNQGLALVKMNENGKMLWRSKPIKGYLVGVGLMGDEALVFYREGEDVYKVVVESYAVSNGKMVKKTVLSEGLQKNHWDIKVLNSKGGAFQYLFLRKTAVTKKYPSLDRFLASTQMQFITLNPDLSVKQNVDFKAVENRDFFGVSATKSGSLVVLSQTRDELFAEQIGPNGAVVTELKVACPFGRSQSFTTAVVVPAQKETNSILLSFCYLNKKDDPHFRTISLNFDSKTALLSDDVELQKSARKDSDFVKPEGLITSVPDLRRLQPVDIIEMPNKLAVVCQLQTEKMTASMSGSPSGTATVFNAMLVYFLDDNLKTVGEIGIKKLETHKIAPSTSVAAHLVGDKLLLVSQGMSGPTNFKPLMAKIDVNNMKIESLELFEKLMDKTSPLEPAATFWFEKGFVVSYLETNLTGGRMWMVHEKGLY